MATFKSITKKIKENISELSGTEIQEENYPPLFEMLPHIINISIQKDKPILPRLIENITKEEQNSFVYHCLNLMAATIAERKHFTVYDYESISNASKEIFGEEALHTRFQAKLHSTLLQDYSTESARLKTIENFRVFLEENKENINISKSLLDTLYNALCLLSLEDQRKKYHIPSRFFEEVDLLFMEHNVQRKKEKILSFVDGNIKNSFLPTKFFSLKAKQAKEEHFFFNKDKIPFINTLKERKNYLLSQQENKVFSKESELRDLENYALSFRDDVLLDQIHAFRSLLLPQDFRIVVLGEGKRGKSSLINALLGQNLLPTKPIIPETGTLIELYHTKETSYEIEWINKREFEKLEEVHYNEESNLLLKKKFNNLKQILNNDSLFSNLQSLSIIHSDELSDFISADGLYTPLIKKVRIGLPSDSLPKGILLVDTPATNASDPFYNILTKEECFKADCLIYVLDSRKPDSYSELLLLRELAKKGRAIKIIGVLTHPMESKIERTLAKQRAIQTLQEGIREVQEIELIDVFSFNPKEIVETYEKRSLFEGLQKEKFDNEYLAFINAVTTTIKGNLSPSFVKRLETSYTHLLDFAQNNKEENKALSLKNSPEKQHIELLKKHALHLAQATEEYAEHARSLILNVIHDIDAWRANSERAIALLQERISTQIVNAMHTHAHSLGNDFAKEDAWKDFDEHESSLIARTLIDDFTATQKADLYAWEEKFQLFNNDIQELSLQCLSEIQKTSTELNVLCSTNSKLDHILVQTASYMQKITLFLTGAGSGLLASSGVFNLLALGSATLAFLTVPAVLPSALLVGAGAYALRSFVSPLKRKALFLKRKEAKIQEFAENVASELYARLDQIQEELMLTYSQSIHKSLAPALEIMAGEAVNIHLYLQVIEKQEKQMSIR